MKLNNIFKNWLSVSLIGAFISLNATADVVIDNAWMRLLPPTSKMTAAYMTLLSDQDDRLISVSSTIAEVVEIHESSMKDGVMSMQKQKCLFLPKGEKIELKPKSYHLMVMGLKEPLKEGAEYPFTLEFEQAGSMRVQVPVYKP